MRVAGHDDHPWSRFTCPSLTTVSQDYGAIASRSVNVLFDLISGEGPGTDRCEYLHQGALIMRGSA